MKTIKKDGDYAIVQNEKWYEVYCDGEPLTTPYGKAVHTLYLPLAEKLLKDWKEQGYDSYTEPTSILSYHFTMVDNFSSLGLDEILNMLNSMNWEQEWSLQPCPSPDPQIWMKWVSYFGVFGKKADIIRKWLNNQTHMQLVASTCVYNAFMSYNVAFFMASVVESLPASQHKKAIKDFYGFYSMFDSTYYFDEVWEIFECFRLYYGIHFKEDGKHIPQPEE